MFKLILIKKSKDHIPCDWKASISSWPISSICNSCGGVIDANESITRFTHKNKDGFGVTEFKLTHRGDCGAAMAFKLGFRPSIIELIRNHF